MADFGYDVSDHCDVDPVFGTLADVDALVAEAHERGLRVLLDWVPNHTSDEHPWFAATHPRPRTSGATARARRRRAAQQLGAGASRSRRRCRPGPATTRTGQWYLHLFLPEQPDLDWATPSVVEAMHDVLRFWLDRGVDGFRVDVVHCHRQGPGPARRPARAGRHPPLAPSTTTRAPTSCSRGIRRAARRLPGDRMVGRRGLPRSATASPSGTATTAGDELHLAFDFPPLLRAAGATPTAGASGIDRIDAAFAADDGRGRPGCCRNHDNPRHRTRYGGARRGPGPPPCCCSALRGTPFLYAGEELGLEDAVVPPDRVVDPGGRDGCRAPMPWTAGAGHGWGGRPVAAVPARRRRPARSRPSAPTRARCCASTGGCSPPGKASPALRARRPRACSTAPATACLAWDAAPTATTGGRVLVSMADERGAVAGRASTAGSSRSPATAPPARATPARRRSLGRRPSAVAALTPG